MLRCAPCGCAILLTACTSLPGRDFPRTALPVTQPPKPALLQSFAAAAGSHPAQSGFRLFPVGVDGLLLRLELIAQARASLDLQYYIFHGDESGRLITEEIGRAHV